ncbi:MAG: T9SS type A sorting domain-containing protein, partial [bacterium]
YKVFQSYPNPFNAETVIEYELPEPGQVVMKVYNLVGKEVATLVNAKQTKGKYRISFDASHLPSGIYVYRLIANNQTVAKKMLVTK